jgi:signal transduction histidine kinase
MAEAAVERVERLLDVTTAFSHALTPTEVAQVVIDQAFDQLGASKCLVMSLDSTGSFIELVTETGIPDEEVGSWSRLPLDLDVPATEVVRTGQPIWLSSHADRLGRYPLLAESPIAAVGSSAAIPLIVDDRIAGVLGIAFDEERELTEAERTFALVLARQCAQALDRTRLFEAERQARASAELVSLRMTRLQEVVASITRALTAGEASEIILRQAIDVLGATVGSVLLLSDDGTALEIVGQLNYPGDVLAGWHRIPLDLHVQATEAFLGGVPVWIHSRQEAIERYPVLAKSRMTGANAFAAIPLIADGETIGVMGLSFPEAREFRAEDRLFLSLLSHQGALALERARLFEAEQRARATAEAAVRSREEFLSIAAHELKTPLTSVKGFAQMLSRQLRNPQASPERVQGLAASLESQVLRLEALVADLLDVSRIEQGRLALRVAPADLVEIAERSLAQFESAPERTERHALVLDASGPAPGVWDAGRIEQVLVNLISNALKYSPQGGTVSVRIANDAGHAVVIVRDEGLGIAPDEIERLFAPFTRAVDTRHTVSGSGLGLYITARIVGAHGGEISVESAPGAGSAFTVRLPRTPPTAEPS